jgi:hypothetical protein
MQRRLGAVGQEAAAAALGLRLGGVADDALLAGHQRLEPVAGHVGRIVLGTGAELGVLQVGALEELGVGRAGLNVAMLARSPQGRRTFAILTVLDGGTALTLRALED